MLKVDKLQVQNLASDDEATRVAAAEHLEKLDHGHFEDHPISFPFVKKLRAALLRAHHATASPLVKDWIAQVLAEGGAEGDDIDVLVAEALTPDCTYLPTLLYYISTKHWRFHALKQKVKALYRHPDEEVRWRVAYVLEKFPLTRAEDVECMSALATDSHSATRMHAVLAFRHFGARTPQDLAVMSKVIEMGDDAASVYAKGTLSRGP